MPEPDRSLGSDGVNWPDRPDGPLAPPTTRQPSRDERSSATYESPGRQTVDRGLAAETGHALEVRIGIDTGPVVAGVIGRAKFSYDLWGDTVNTASRMQSHAARGAIQVTARTFDRLRHRYELRARGTIEVKGKGLMRPYLLLGRRSDHEPPTVHDLHERARDRIPPPR